MKFTLVLCLVPILVSACGSSASKSSDASSKSGTSASTGGAATGNPILVGAIDSLSGPLYAAPDAKQGLEAAIDELNAAGGVGGRPLKLDMCDTQLTVNLELSCARKLVADKVSAVLCPFLIADQSGAEYKLWQQAGIVTLGGTGTVPYEMSDSNSFPLDGGVAGLAYGTAAQVVAAGARNVTLIGDNGGATVNALKLVHDALDSAGVTNRTVLADAASDPTFATSAAKAVAGGTDGIVNFSVPQYIPKVVAALRGAGYAGPIVQNNFGVPVPVLQALGKDGNGLLVTSGTALVSDTANPAVSKYIADVNSYATAHSEQPMVSDTGITFWSSVKLFAAIMAKATAYDAAGVKAAASAVSTPIDIRSIGPWQSVGVTSPLSDQPRIFNPTVAFGVIKDGKIVASSAGGFVNPFTTLSAHKKK